VEEPRKDERFSFSVIIIGRNEGERLLRCIESVRAMRGGFSPPEIVYVDSASSDGSGDLARKAGARVIELSSDNSSAAKGRNAGWKTAAGEYILFLDGDTILAPDFVEKARDVFKDPVVAAVAGDRREIFPQKNLFHRACDLEWITPYGERESLGGDALIRRKVLEEIGGYEESLKVGEDPEMFSRIRQKGYKALHLNLPMTGHDLNMLTWGQYWQRAVRSGYAYAEVTDRFPGSVPESWKHVPRRNVFHACLLLIVAVLAAAASFQRKDFLPLGLLFFVFLIMVLRRAYKEREKTKDIKTLLAYGIHVYLATLPSLWGHAVYFWNKYRGLCATACPQRKA